MKSIELRLPDKNPIIIPFRSIGSVSLKTNVLLINIIGNAEPLRYLADDAPVYYEKIRRILDPVLIS